MNQRAKSDNNTAQENEGNDRTDPRSLLLLHLRFVRPRHTNDVIVITSRNLHGLTMITGLHKTIGPGPFTHQICDSVKIHLTVYYITKR